MSSPENLSAAELVAAFARGDLSPVEAMQAVLDRAQGAGAALNAFCFLQPEAAMAAARASERRWRSGEPLGPLDGVPVSVKDNIVTHDMPTRFGSLALSEDQWIQPDSPSVARLREAGAIAFGKTALPDFAHKIVTDSPFSGVTRNPWSLDHTPGGSSGGASAAVAAGLGPLALGTDGGGSIRIPAAFTGTFGLKPSFGRVPHHPRGAFAPLSHIGPMTRDVADAALMMNAICRPDHKDWYSLPYDGADYTTARRGDLKGLRVAYSEKLGLPDVTVAPEVADAVRKAALLFEQLGAVVEKADPPAVKRSLRAHGIMWVTLSAQLASKLGERSALLDESLRALVEDGSDVPRDIFVNAWLDRGEIGREASIFFEAYDILLSPVHNAPPPTLSSSAGRNPPLPVFTPWSNQTGMPAASIYCGMTRDCLPIGLQVVGRRFADAAVLSVCQVFEDAYGKAPRPSLA